MTEQPTYLNVKDVAKRYALTPAAIWNWISDGPYSNPSFPKPYRLAAQTIRWKLSDLEAWEASRMEGAA